MHLQSNHQMKHIFLSFALIIFIQSGLMAQSTSGEAKKKKVTLTSGVESNLLQLAQVKLGSYSFQTVPRYTYFFNTATDINFEVSKHIKPFTGITLRNIGFIVKGVDTTARVKNRVYTLGAPLGLKFYLSKKNKCILKVGADLSLAMDYKWKTFDSQSKRATKKKDHEFFSKDVSSLFYSVFAGISYKGFSVSGNYYLNNFYSSKSLGEVQLFTLGLGINFENNAMKKKKEKNKTTSTSNTL